MPHRPTRFRREMRQTGRAKGAAQQHQRPCRRLIPFAIRRASHLGQDPCSVFARVRRRATAPRSDLHDCQPALVDASHRLGHRFPAEPCLLRGAREGGAGGHRQQRFRTSHRINACAAGFPHLLHQPLLFLRPCSTLFFSGSPHRGLLSSSSSVSQRTISLLFLQHTCQVTHQSGVQNA